MIKINGTELISQLTEPDADMPKGQITRIQREIDAGFKRFCARRGIDPLTEGFVADMNGGISSGKAERERLGND